MFYQKELFFDESVETFRTSYEKLNAAIVSLFVENWESIRDNLVSSVIQSEKGTYHRKADFRGRGSANCSGTCRLEGGPGEGTADGV